VSGRFAIAKHLDSVVFDDKDTLVVEVSLGMVRIHSTDSDENMYKLRSVDHIQIDGDRQGIRHTRKKKYFGISKVRTMVIFFAVDVG
jgi:hypothetical protein